MRVVLLVHRVFQVMLAEEEKLVKKALLEHRVPKDGGECQEHRGCPDFQEKEDYLVCLECLV